MDKKLKQQIAEIMAEYFLNMEVMIAEAIDKILHEKYGALLKLIEEKAVPGAKGEPGQSGTIVVEKRLTEKETTILQPIHQVPQTVQVLTPITSEEIKQRLMELPIEDSWFNAEHIFGITKIIRSLMSDLKLGGGGGTIEFFTITGAVNGSNTSFTLPRVYANPIICYNGQTLRPTNHYTISGIALTLLTAPKSGTLFGFGQPA